VRPNRTRTGLELLDDHHFALGVTFLGEQRRPQARVAGAHDAEIGPDVADQRGVRRRFEWVRIEPPQIRLDVSEVA